MKTFRNYINSVRGIFVAFGTLIGVFGLAIGLLEGFSTIGVTFISALLLVVVVIPLCSSDASLKKYLSFLSRFS